jgi:hypothetical protein
MTKHKLFEQEAFCMKQNGGGSYKTKQKEKTSTLGKAKQMPTK